jgi:hypothetical protein
MRVEFWDRWWGRSVVKGRAEHCGGECGALLSKEGSSQASWKVRKERSTDVGGTGLLVGQTLRAGPGAGIPMCRWGSQGEEATLIPRVSLEQDLGLGMGEKRLEG